MCQKSTKLLVPVTFKAVPCTVFRYRHILNISRASPQFQANNGKKRIKNRQYLKVKETEPCTGTFKTDKWFRDARGKGTMAHNCATNHDRSFVRHRFGTGSTAGFKGSVSRD